MSPRERGCESLSRARGERQACEWEGAPTAAGWRSPRVRWLVAAIDVNGDGRRVKWVVVKWMETPALVGLEQ